MPPGKPSPQTDRVIPLQEFFSSPSDAPGPTVSEDTPPIFSGDPRIALIVREFNRDRINQLIDTIPSEEISGSWDWIDRMLVEHPGEAISVTERILSKWRDCHGAFSSGADRENLEFTDIFRARIRKQLDIIENLWEQEKIPLDQFKDLQRLSGTYLYALAEDHQSAENELRIAVEMGDTESVVPLIEVLMLLDRVKEGLFLLMEEWKKKRTPECGRRLMYYYFEI